MRDLLLLLAVGASCGYAVFNYGGATAPEWNYCLAAIGLIAATLWLTSRASEFSPRIEPRIFWLLALIPAWVLLQLAPMPTAWIRILSPARAELADALSRIAPARGQGISRWISLSAAPSITFAYLERVAAGILVFLSVRELTWRFAKRPWVAALPIILIGTAEAVGGTVQYFGGAAEAATGTYVNRNHFAGLLEMTLPFALMLMWASFVRGGRARGNSLRWAVPVCLGMVCSTLTFLGVVYSLSRMGLIAALFSISILVALAGAPALGRRGKIILGAGLPMVVAVFLFFTLPVAFVERLSDGRPGSDETADSRLAVWKETSHLIADYPVFGCGLGTYASIFQKYRSSMPLYLVDYAHNDYLQAVAELGLPGAALLLAFGILTLKRAWTAASARLKRATHFLAAACAAALSAIALHALADFNFYIPANALIAAWIAGMASALDLTRRERPLATAGLERFTEYSA